MQANDTQAIAIQPPRTQLQLDLDRLLADSYANISNMLDHCQTCITDGCRMTDISNYLQSVNSKVKEDHLAIRERLAKDIGELRLRDSLLKAKMNEIGLNRQQIDYLLQASLPRDGSLSTESLKHAGHFSDKFYDVLDKLNVAKKCALVDMSPSEISQRISDAIRDQCLEATPVKTRLRSLNHTLEYLNNENHRLRCEIAIRDNAHPAPEAAELLQKLEQEEHEEQEKLGVMSREYEQKIMRLREEDAEVAHHLQRHIQKLEDRNNRLAVKLRDARMSNEILEETLKEKDRKLTKEYIEHGMMLERANQEFRELSSLFESASQSKDQPVNFVQQGEDSPAATYTQPAAYDSNPAGSLFQSELIGDCNPLGVVCPPLPSYYHAHHSLVQVTKTTTYPAQDFSSSMGPAPVPSQHLEEQVRALAQQNQRLEQDCANFQTNLKLTVDNYERKIRELSQAKDSLRASQSTAFSNPLVQNPPFRLAGRHPPESMEESREVDDLKQKVRNYELKIQHLESSMLASGQTTPSESNIQAPRSTPAFEEVQHYLQEIQRLRELVDSLHEQKERQCSENKRLKDEQSRLALKLHAVDSQRRRAETHELQEASELRKLRAEIQELRGEREAHREEFVPKALMQSEIKVYLGQISQLTKKLSALDAQLEGQARELWEIRTEKSKYCKRAELLEERIEELEKEEEGCLQENEAKQAELRMLKAVLMSTKHKKDKALEELHADEQVIEAMQKSTQLKDRQIAELSDKIRRLESVPQGVPADEVKKHLFMIGELTQRASLAEQKLKEQMAQLERVNREEDEHRQSIVALNQKLKDVQSEAVSTRAEVEVRDKKISSFKKLLADASKRLERLSAENDLLVDENKRDMILINESMAGSNKHLSEIGQLADTVRQQEDALEQSAGNDEENATYMAAIADLRVLLRRAEEGLLAKSAMVDKLEDLEDRMGRKIADLTRQILRLEADKQQTAAEKQESERQVDCLKSALDLALVKLQTDERRLIEDADQIERGELDADCYREESERRGQTVQLLERRAAELEADLRASQALVEALRQKVEEKCEQALGVEKEERELRAQVHALSNRCRALESCEKAQESELDDAEEQLAQYKKLFQETAKKYQELVLQNATAQSQLKTDEKKLYEMEAATTVEVAALRDRIAELEAIPRGVPQEEVEQHLHKISELATKLNIAEQKATAAAGQLNAVVREEGEARRVAAMLEEKVKQLEMSADLVSGLDKEAHDREVLRYKAMLLTATERMRDLARENREMKAGHSRDVALVEEVVAETNARLAEFNALTEKLAAKESECAHTKEQLTLYNDKIKELAERLTAAERLRLEKESSVRQLEARAAKSERLIGSLSEENRCLSAQISVMHKKLQEAEQDSHRQANHALTVRLAQMSDRTRDLEAKNSELSRRLAEVIEHMTPTTAAKYLPESMLQEAKTDLAVNQDEVEDMHPDTVRLLKKKLESVQKELNEIKEKPRVVSSESVKAEKQRNKELSRRVRELESQLKARDQVNKDKNQVGQKLSHDIESLQERINKLESEKAQADGEISTKAKEINALKDLVKETKSKLEETVMVNHALSIQQQKTAEKQARIAMIKDAQIAEMKNLKAKIAELSSVQKGVPEGVYQDKLATINGLYSQLMFDEEVIQKQREEMQESKNQADRLMSVIIVLNEKISSLEREEKHEEEFIQERNTQIASLKDSLKQTIEHLKEVTDKNFELDTKHKADSQKQRETLAKMNTCLVCMALIARQNKKLEMKANEEANRYLTMINELTQELMTAEKNLEQKGHNLENITEAEKQHRDQIIRLSQRVTELEAEESQIIEENEEQSEELQIAKEELRNALNRANIRECQIEEMREAILEDSTLMHWFEEETERYRQTLTSLASEVEKVKSESKSMSIEHTNRFLKHIASLSLMLKDTEQALMIKDQELKSETELEKMNTKHAKLLQSKIVELETLHNNDSQALKEKERELNFYRTLLESTNEKLVKELEDLSPVKRSREDLNRPEMTELRKRIGMIPNSVASDQLNNYLEAVSTVIDKLHSSKSKLSYQSERIEELQVLKQHQLQEIDVLTERMVALQKENESTSTEAISKSEKFNSLKKMLDDTTKRLEANIKENAELKMMNQLEVEAIQEKVDEGSLHLLQISNLSKQVDELKEASQADRSRELVPYLAEIEVLTEQLNSAREALLTEMDIIENAHAVDLEQQAIVDKLFERIKELQAQDSEKDQKIVKQENELEALKAVLDDTVDHLRLQAEAREKLEATLAEEKLKLAETAQKDDTLIHSKDEKIRFLEESVASFAKELMKVHDSESNSKNIIRQLAHKISVLEKDQQQNIGEASENRAELEMYKNLLEEWKDKLHDQVHINQTFKNKVVEEGQILALRSSLWPASQFNLLLHNIQRLEQMPEELSNSELSQFVPEASSLMTDLVIQEEEFLSKYHKLNRKLKEESSLALDTLSTVINECSPTRNNNRCIQMAIETLGETSELSLHIRDDIERERAGLQEEGDKILHILEKIGSCLAHIALVIETAETEGSSEDNKQSLRVYLCSVDSLCSKIEYVTSTFREAFESHKQRINKRHSSSKIEEVQKLLESMANLELYEESTPRPDRSISNHKAESELRKLIAEAETIKQSIAGQNEPEMRPYELVGVLSQRIVHMEEEKRAYSSLNIRTKMHVISLLMSVLEQDSHCSSAAGKELQELITELEVLAELYLADAYIRDPTSYRAQMTKIELSIQKLVASKSVKPESEPLIRRLESDIGRLQSFQVKHGSVLVSDMLEGALSLLEASIKKLNEAHRDVLSKTSAVQDEHLQAREWDAKKIEEQRNTIEDLRDILFKRESQLKDAYQKIDQLSAKLSQLRDELNKSESSQLSIYGDQISIMRQRIAQLEKELQIARGHSSTAQIVQPEGSLNQHNESLIKRLHSADQSLMTLSQLNHQYQEEIRLLSHKLQENNMAYRQKQHFEDKIIQLQGELALSKHKNSLTEEKLKGKISQLLHAIYLLRLELQKKQAAKPVSDPKQPQMCMEDEPKDAKEQPMEKLELTEIAGKTSHSELQADVRIKPDMTSRQ